MKYITPITRFIKSITGEPWKYLSSLKKIRNQYLCDESQDTDLTFTVSRGDNRYIYENVKNITSSTVATSTPHKMDSKLNV